MTGRQSFPELPVPDAAMLALSAHTDGFDDPAETVVRKVAGPVVVAELRRLADLWTDDWMVQSWLRKRAAVWEAGS